MPNPLSIRLIRSIFLCIIYFQNELNSKIAAESNAVGAVQEKVIGNHVCSTLIFVET